MNVYRKRYDVPDDLRVRKSDRDIREAVRSSEALVRVQKMLDDSIHPSLLFFEKDMPEKLITVVVQKLQIEDKFVKKDEKKARL